MQVSVSRDHAGDPGELTVVAAEPRSRLVHRANVGAGVLLEVDVLAPCRWLSLSVDAVDNLSGPIVEAMVGAGGADSFRAGRGRTALDVDLTAAVPWLRVAQVDAFDRWLHLPLDQAIVDAERGVSRLRAARTLPAGSPARQAVLGDALRIARRASAGVVAHLRQLADTRISVPVRLRSAIDQLVDGYAGLATVVAGSDRELAAVPAAWRTLRDRVHPVDADRWCRSQTPGLADRPVAAAAVSLLDPRQVKARVLAMSADPASAEVRMVSTAIGDRVRIEVPAFGTTVDEDLASRLRVRLMDRDVVGPVRQGILTSVASRSAGRRFQCTLLAAGLDLHRLRADVYDARSVVPPAVADSDADLREVRRAAAFLGEWRRLIAAARLPVTSGVLADGLRRLANSIDYATSGPGGTSFHGGPTADELIGMIGPDHAATIDRLRTAGAEPKRVRGALGSAVGPGELLVAELSSAAVDVA